MHISDYLAAQTGLNQSQLAQRAGMQKSKLSRQLSGESTLTMETLRDVARGAGLDMLEVFAAAGFITRTEEQALRAAGNIARATDEDLAAEVLRRMQAGSEVMDRPITDAQIVELSERRPSVTSTPMHVAAKDTTPDVPEDDTP